MTLPRADALSLSPAQQLSCLILFALIAWLPCLPSPAGNEASFEQYNQQGMRAYKAGNDAEAERLLRLAAAEADGFPADDPRLEKTLRNLSIVCINQGKLAEAEEVLRKSLLVKEKAFGKGSRETATTLNDLGVLCYQQSKYGESEQFFQRVLDMDERNLPPNHPERATTLQNYAQMLRKTRRDAEAEKMEIRAKQILASPPKAREGE